MKSAKHITISLILTICAFCAVLYTSCKKEKNECLNVNCLNGGACNYGKCVCPTGFGGTYCEVNTDLCKGVTCLNGSACKDGKCGCLTGTGGTFCGTIFRDAFANTYKGNGVDNGTPPGNYSNYRVVFVPSGTDYTKMQMTYQSASGLIIVTATITLANFISGGAVFTITPTPDYLNAYRYSGSGTFNGNNVALTITETSMSTSESRIYTFASMTKI